MHNPLLQTDVYKFGHMLLYPKGTQVVYETLTPRTNNYFPWADHMVVFGYTVFMNRLEQDFRDNFFSIDKETILNDTREAIVDVLGEANADRIMPMFAKLHDKGYLPVKVQALPEGTRVPMQVPVLTIENTDPDFFWLPGYLETRMLSETFVMSTGATIAREFRSIGQHYADLSADNSAYLDFQFHDFSMRGQRSMDSALLSGIAHLTSFKGTDVITAPHYLRLLTGDYDSVFGGSVIATEHSIMEARGADQYKAYAGLIKENPEGILSIVSDTYNYWEVIDEVLPSLKEEIMTRNGKVVIRPDTSDQYFSGFSDDTQVLTQKGWVPITSITKDVNIGVVNSDGKLTFEKPIKISAERYTGKMVHFKDNFGKLDLLVTPEYELNVLQEKKDGTKHERNVFAKKVTTEGHAGQSHTRSAELFGDVSQLTLEERLNIAFQADGDKMEYGMSNYRMVFQFSKQRKINRMKTLLDQLNYTYRLVRSQRTKGNWKEEYKFIITLPNTFRKEPTFTWVQDVLFTKDSTWAKEFIDEVSQWDSTIRNEGRIKYDSTVKVNSDVVELVALMAGYGAYTSVYQDARQEYFSDVHTVNILKDNRIGGQARHKENLNVSNMNITSVTTSTGKLLIKRNKGYLVANDNSNNKVGVETLLVSTLESLWNTFGGTVNAKGYKVLDPHVGLLHREGVTLDNVEDYFDAILDAGFSAENIIFGLGAYVYSVLSTRDSFGQAVKATSVTINGVEKAVYKDPKTKTESFKKSLRGRVLVTKEKGEYKVEDNFDVKTLNAHLDKQELHTIFEGGISIAPVDFKGIRQTILDDI